MNTFGWIKVFTCTYNWKLIILKSRFILNRYREFNIKVTIHNYQKPNLYGLNVYISF